MMATAVWIPRAVVGVRRVQHVESASRDDLGRRFPDRRPAREGASGRNGCVARFCHLGPDPGKNDSWLNPAWPSHSWLCPFDDFLFRRARLQSC